MLVHLVLFRPRADVTDAERDALFEAMRDAATGIETVRGFRVGRHLDPALPYKLDGFPSYPWVALLEFDDQAGLQAYLAHPRHRALGERFNAAAESALIYDFTITDSLR